jgi:hypothetical protein
MQQQLKTYAFTPQRKVYEALLAWNSNPHDPQAAAIVDDAVKERMSRTEEAYSVALHAIIREGQQASAAAGLRKFC